MTYPFEAPRWFVQQGAQPAAGAEWSMTPIRLGTWLLKRLCFTFVTSIAVANRIPSLQVFDGNAVTFRCGAPAAILTGVTTQFVGFNGANPNATAGGIVTLSWPENGLMLRQGDVLSSVTAGLDVADQYSAIAALVYEMPSGPTLRMDPSEPIYSEQISF